MKQLDYNRLLETEWANKFSEGQVGQIRRGLKNGVDVSVYAKPEYGTVMMAAIRQCLEAGEDPSIYTNYTKVNFSLNDVDPNTLDICSFYPPSLYAFGKHADREHD